MSLGAKCTTSSALEPCHPPQPLRLAVKNVLTNYCEDITPGTVTRSNSGRTARTNNRWPRVLFPDRSYVVIENRTARGNPHLSMSSPFSAVYSSNSNLSQIDLFCRVRFEELVLPSIKIARLKHDAAEWDWLELGSNVIALHWKTHLSSQLCSSLFAAITHLSLALCIGKNPQH